VPERAQHNDNGTKLARIVMKLGTTRDTPICQRESRPIMLASTMISHIDFSMASHAHSQVVYLLCGTVTNGQNILPCNTITSQPTARFHALSRSYLYHHFLFPFHSLNKFATSPKFAVCYWRLFSTSFAIITTQRYRGVGSIGSVVVGQLVPLVVR
jgi:hypothetical protein